MKRISSTENYSLMSITAPEPTVRPSHLDSSKREPFVVILILGRNEFALAEILRCAPNLRRKRRPICDGAPRVAAQKGRTS